MVALDNAALFGPGPRIARRISLEPLVALLTALAVLLVVGAWMSRGFGENGFRLGSMLAWRFTSIVFFLAIVAGPVCRIACRLFGMECPSGLSRKLIWGFCASYGVYLLSVFLPNVIRLSAGAMVMVLFGAGIVVMMAMSAAPLTGSAGHPLMGEKMRRVFLGTAAIYFWSGYAVMALSHLYGPHRPDAFYSVSLSLMVGALLLRFADRLVVRNEAKPAIA